MAVELKADVGEKVRILEGEHKGKEAEILCIHGYGTVSAFVHLYEPAYEVLIPDDNIQMRLDSKEIEKL